MMDIQDVIRKVSAFHENMQQLKQQFEDCFQTVDSIINNENDIKINETLIKSLDTLLQNLKQLIEYENQEMTPIIDDNATDPIIKAALIKAENTREAFTARIDDYAKSLARIQLQFNQNLHQFREGPPKIDDLCGLAQVVTTKQGSVQTKQSLDVGLASPFPAPLPAGQPLQTQIKMFGDNLRPQMTANIDNNGNIQTRTYQSSDAQFHMDRCTRLVGSINECGNKPCNVHTSTVPSHMKPPNESAANYRHCSVYEKFPLETQRAIEILPTGSNASNITQPNRKTVALNESDKPDSVHSAGNEPLLAAKLDPLQVTDINASNKATANDIEFDASADAKQNKIMHENCTDTPFNVNSNDHIKYAYQPSAANKHNSHERKLRLSPAIDSNTPNLNINKVDVINDHAYASQADGDKINPTVNLASVTKLPAARGNIYIPIRVQCNTHDPFSSATQCYLQRPIRPASQDSTKVNIGSKVYNTLSDVTPGQIPVAQDNIDKFNPAIDCASIIKNVNTRKFTGEISPNNVKQYPTIIQGDQTYLKLHRLSNQMAVLTTAIYHSQQAKLVLILISHVFELLFTQRMNQKQSVLPENVHYSVDINYIGDKNKNFCEDLN